MASASDQYSISIRASLEAEQAQAGLEQLSSTITEVRGTSTGALENIGKSADDLGDVFDDLDDSVGRTSRGLGAAGLLAAALVVIPVLFELGRRVKEAWEEHERLQSLADRLDLPTREVKSYSEAWLDVAIAMDDVARGFGNLSDAQKRGFDTLGLDQAGGARAIQQGLTRIAAATGTRDEKITALQILTGKSYEEMEAELDKELERLSRFTSTKRIRRTTVAQAEGVVFGQEDVGQLLRSGALLAPAHLKAEQDRIDAAEKAEKERVRLAEEAARKLERLRREEADAFADSVEIQVEHAHIGVDRIAEVYDRWDRETMTLAERQGAYLDEFQSKLEELRSANEITAEEYAERWNEALDSVLKEVVVTHKKLGDGLTDLQRAIRDNITEPVKEGLRNMAIQGEFTIKSLVRNVIAALLQKQLYDAIDKLGNALSSALSGGGGGLGGAIAGLLGVGSAGGGFRDRPGPVTEDGAELLVPTSGGVRVLNQRQLAFAAGHSGGSPMGSGGGSFAPVYAPVYNISGVDTQAVIGYVESTRRSDQERWVKTMYDNGFGRLK